MFTQVVGATSNENTRSYLSFSRGFVYCLYFTKIKYGTLFWKKIVLSQQVASWGATTDHRIVTHICIRLLSTSIKGKTGSDVSLSYPLYTVTCLYHPILIAANWQSMSGVKNLNSRVIWSFKHSSFTLRSAYIIETIQVIRIYLMILNWLLQITLNTSLQRFQWK